MIWKLSYWKDEAFVTKDPNSNNNTFAWIDMKEMYSNDNDRIDLYN